MNADKNTLIILYFIAWSSCSNDPISQICACIKIFLSLVVVIDIRSNSLFFLHDISIIAHNSCNSLYCCNLSCYVALFATASSEIPWMHMLILSDNISDDNADWIIFIILHFGALNDSKLELSIPTIKLILHGSLSDPFIAFTFT